MPQAMRHTLLSLRELLVSAGPFVLLTVALLALAYWWLDPNPPKRVTLATGPAQSAYDEFGKRYKAALAVNGIDVVLLPSEGSSANLQLLHDGKADLGFVQGGSGDAQDTAQSGLTSLGSLFVEPIWLFYREDAARKISGTTDATLTGLTQLTGLRVNVGTRGSGVPSLMDKLLEANRVDPASIQLSQLEQTPATVAFLGGDLDAIVFASAPEALMVQMLLQTPGVKLMNFAQSEAYSRRFAFLTPVVLPRGVVDLAGDVPPQNVRLVASTTTLLARDATHPALLQLFSQAAQTLHSGAGWFNRAHEFPNANNTEYPLAKEAERTIRNGAPLLQRYLPFWLANLVERMWLALGIIVAVLLPLSRIVPPLYQFRIRSRVFRWYGRLREIENQLEIEPGSSRTLVQELDALERHVGKVSIPLSYADELYALRNHIEMVRKKLLKA
ncbi:MAG: TAXI family TRAP transporter solute-binding subunit [Rhodoferax sp.]|nr:TAXI family TRAP transporter solute-binding subunit [Rhodoferax sp.]